MASLGNSMATTGRSTGRFSTGRSSRGQTKKKPRNYEYELDKLRKENQLQKEALQEKERKIQELSGALDEMKRLSSSELETMQRAFYQLVKKEEQDRLKAYTAATEQDRVIAAAKKKAAALQRERGELVRALYAVAAECTKARAFAEPVYGREEVFPKKVEPWLALSFDKDFVPSPRKAKGGRSSLRSSAGSSASASGAGSLRSPTPHHHLGRTLPFNGAGTVLLGELASLVQQTCTKYVEQGKVVQGLRAQVAEARSDLKRGEEQSGEVDAVVAAMLEEVREGSRQRGLTDFPSTAEIEGCSNQTKLSFTLKQLKAFNSRFDEVNDRCKTFETQAVELEFYAKLHGKLVQQAYHEQATSTT